MSSIGGTPKSLRKFLNNRPRSDRPEADSRAKNLVAVCACHLSRDNLRHFVEMLISWAEQTCAVHLHVHFSCDEEIDARHFADASGKLVTFHVTPSRLAQMEHYRLLFRKLADLGTPPDTWLLFTDGNSLWHPARTFAVAQAVGAEGGQDVKLFQFGGVAQAAGADDFALAESVTEGVRAGTVTVNNEQHSWLVTYSYWAHSARLADAQRAAEALPPTLLQHTFGSVAFLLAIINEGEFVRYGVPPTPQDWLYYHRPSCFSAGHVLWAIECCGLTDILSADLTRETRAALLQFLHFSILQGVTTPTGRWGLAAVERKLLMEDTPAAALAAIRPLHDRIITGLEALAKSWEGFFAAPARPSPG